MNFRIIIFFIVCLFIFSQTHSKGSREILPDTIQIELTSGFLKNSYNACMTEEKYSVYPNIFSCIIEISNTELNQILLKNIKFEKDIVIKGTKINTSSAFGYNMFEKRVYLLEDKIFGDLLFQDCIFKDEFEFRFNVVNNKLDFYKITFDSSVNIYFSSFNDRVRLLNVVFNDDVSFELSTFKSLKIDDVTFNANVNFFKTTLPDIFTFKNVKIKGDEIDFTKIKLNNNEKKCLIDLTGTDINKIRLRLDKFDIYFPDTSHEVRIGVYEQLLKNFKDNGFKDSYQKLDIEYRKYKAEHKGGIYLALDYFYEHWWNYGYEPEWVFQWTSGLWVLFSISLLFNIGYFQKNIYEVELVDMPEKVNSYTWLSSSEIVDERKWINKIKVILHLLPIKIKESFVYTAVIFFGLKMNSKNFVRGVYKKHPLLFIYLILIYLLGLFCVGYFVNIIFKY